MSKQRASVELTRSRYQPTPILTLFVGESAPSGDDFFYYGTSALTGYMKQAMAAAGLDVEGDFLERFKSYGWYLDDLVLVPINAMPRSERKKLCREAKDSLTERIAEYRPAAIVSLLLSIQNLVSDAAKEANSCARIFAVPFAGNGQQNRFLEAMAGILPQLPRTST